MGHRFSDGHEQADASLQAVATLNGPAQPGPFLPLGTGSLTSPFFWLLCVGHWVLKVRRSSDDGGAAGPVGRCLGREPLSRRRATRSLDTRHGSQAATPADKCSGARRTGHFLNDAVFHDDAFAFGRLALRCTGGRLLRRLALRYTGGRPLPRLDKWNDRDGHVARLGGSAAPACSQRESRSGGEPTRNAPFARRLRLRSARRDRRTFGVPRGETQPSYTGSLQARGVRTQENDHRRLRWGDSDR